MMQLRINGKVIAIDRPLQVQELLDMLAVQGRVAVEVNGDIIPRSEFNAHVLQPGDAVEIVRAIGGG